MPTIYREDYEVDISGYTTVEFDMEVSDLYDDMSESERHEMADFLVENGYFEGEDTRHRPRQAATPTEDPELQIERILDTELDALPDELIDGLREKLSISKPEKISTNDSVISEIKLLFSSYEQGVVNKTPMLNELNLLIANL